MSADVLNVVLGLVSLLLLVLWLKRDWDAERERDRRLTAECERDMLERRCHNAEEARDAAQERAAQAYERDRLG